MPGHIVPMGAGKAVMERRNDPLHDYVLELTGKSDPVVLFLPTATGDEASYIVSFYEAFHSERCRPQHLRLFHRDYDDLTDIYRKIGTQLVATVLRTLTIRDELPANMRYVPGSADPPPSARAMRGVALMSAAPA